MRDQIIINSDKRLSDDVVDKIKACFDGAAVNTIERHDSCDGGELKRSVTISADNNSGKSPSANADTIMLVSQRLISNELIKAIPHNSIK